ncbi:potassium two pore domain channel subfamily K member galene isoform X2 [Temnothorax americanus]|uniref:potassium two pore domain channel subfamily K member galene isoform X2 n=1 Tax=Temnothorax americanus TaxID=1964332 RepID=UPI00406928F7
MPRARTEVFDVVEVEKPSRCIKFLRLLWKFSRCVFSHVTLISLVVAYCLIGAYAFESLEANHEREVKKSIKNIRGNVSEKLWEITKDFDVLIRKNWTEQALSELKKFEDCLLKKMEKEGWDGSEEEDDIQWTFAGALFYSIIVITTIGYGHIAPKTKNGKVVTIFYAILGIPLMLLCLSNIGDVMASSFRFLYWKVCCYVCTKPPKKRRGRNNMVRSHSVRQPGYGSNRGPFRRSIRVSQRSADSALGLSESMTKSSYSDTDCRYMSRRLEGGESKAIAAYAPSTNNPMEIKAATVPRYSDIPLATPRSVRAKPRITTQSLDRKLLMSPNEADRSPVLCNKYALDDFEDETSRWRQPPQDKVENSEKPRSNETPEELDGVEKRTSFSPRSLPRRCLSVEGATTTNHRTSSSSGPRPSSIYLEMEYMRRSQSTKSRRTRSNYSVARSYKRGPPPSPRIMSPMGFAVHRQVYADDIDFDYEYYTAADDQERQPTKPVPIWLCVFLVVSYIFGGAYLFSKWEEWHFLDSAYFCFITLTTIGFGDFVPAYKVDAQKGIALCSLYLLFGIALLAMSFNLVQEEVINNVKSVAKRLGIIKETDEEDVEEEEEEEREAEDYDEYDAEYEDEVYENEPKL